MTDTAHNDDFLIDEQGRESKFLQQLPYPIRWFGIEVRWLFRVILSALDRFYWDNGFSRAASLAYTSLLSLFPVTALVFGVLAAFAVSSENISNVREFVFRQFVPSAEVVDKILFYMGEFGKAATDPGSSFSVLAFGFLMFTSILLINSIEGVLNEIWQVFEPRRILDRITIFSAVLLLAPVLAVSAFYFAKLRVESFIGSPALGRAYSFLLPFFFDFAAFFFLNYLVPKAPVKISSSAFGASLSALLFGFAKSGFAVYVTRFASYDRLYGAISAVPVFLVWLYVSWSIVILGAECAYQAQYLPRFGKIWRRSLLSLGDARMILAVQALVMITRAFESGATPPDELEIAEALGCSSTLLKPSLNSLEKAGLIARGGTREGPILLLKASNTVSVRELRDALFSVPVGMQYPAELERLCALFRTKGSLKEVTLADLMKGKGEV